MCALRHTRTQQKLVKTRINKIKQDTCILNALRKLDPVTYKHSLSVAKLAVWFTESTGCDLDRATVYYAGLYHDIGKYHIDDGILNKPSKLDEKEYEAMKKHPELGYYMLKHTGLSNTVLDAVRYHHEKYNGGGYPSGLVAEEIPLLARIIHICDVYDALVSDRPYRKGHSPKEAVEIMKAMQDQFDPALFRKFTAGIQKLQA